MLKLKASLEAVRSRKDVSEDILYRVVFTVYPQNVSDIAMLTAPYQSPIQISIEETK